MVVVAQLVERQIVVLDVAGSSPVFHPKFRKALYTRPFLLPQTMHYFVYILYAKSTHKYYKGQTNDIDARIKRHDNGQEKFTKPGVPWELVLLIEKENRSQAMILEKKLKNMNRDKLEGFIMKYGESSSHDAQAVAV